MYNVVISDHGMLKGRDFQMQNKHLEIHFCSFLSFKKKHWFLFRRTYTWQFFVQLVSQCLSVAVQLHEHHAVGLPATCKDATKEDRGEDNKGPDWLIEQSIVSQAAQGGGVVTLKC